MRHRCALPQPMGLPLPYSQLFSGGRSRQPGGPVVADVLSRLGSSVAARGLAQRIAADYEGERPNSWSALLKLLYRAQRHPVMTRRLFAGLESSGLGRRLLDTWGYDGGEREEIKEGLRALGNAYEC